jgi:hypothetical protein
VALATTWFRRTAASAFALLNAQPGAPQHDDHRSQARAVAIVTGVAHRRHDLIDRGRVGRIPQSLCGAGARRVAGIVPGDRRRPAASGRRCELDLNDRR